MSKEGEQIIHLLKENLKMTRRIESLAIKTERYVFWLKIINILKVVLIAIPLVLALIYLPPVFREIGGVYGELLNELDKLGAGQLFR